MVCNLLNNRLIIQSGSKYAVSSVRFSKCCSHVDIKASSVHLGNKNVIKRFTVHTCNLLMCWESFRRERVSFVNADREAKWLHVANGHLQGNIRLKTRHFLKL